MLPQNSCHSSLLSLPKKNISPHMLWLPCTFSLGSLLLILKPPGFFKQNIGGWPDQTLLRIHEGSLLKWTVPKIQGVGPAEHQFTSSRISVLRLGTEKPTKKGTVRQAYQDPSKKGLSNHWWMTFHQSSPLGCFDRFSVSNLSFDLNLNQLFGKFAEPSLTSQDTNASCSRKSYLQYKPRTSCHGKTMFAKR